ncbi:hypothetical protein GCM10025873_05460 [Demequina sediminis]|nr:hypothetical protein GCM10025873_05460 [Demequina sediminis]
MRGEERIGLGDVHPREEVRIVRAVGAPVGRLPRTRAWIARIRATVSAASSWVPNVVKARKVAVRASRPHGSPR